MASRSTSSRHVRKCCWTARLKKANRAKENQAVVEGQDRLRSEQERKAAEAREREEAEVRRRAEEEARKAEAEAAANAPAAPVAGERPARGRAKPDTTASPLPDPAAEESTSRGKRGKAGKDDRDRSREAAARTTRDSGERRRGKLTISSALGDDADRQRSLASLKRARERERERRFGGGDQREKVSVEVTLPETITLQDLAGRMNERVADVVKFMINQGEMLRGNDIIDADTAELITEEFGHTVRRVAESDVEIGLEGEADDPATLQPRAPIVTIMGHVDHGKTSLLDALRSTDVVAGEAGGITQHIGAYQVQLKSGQKITFLDTPGHSAFTAMRARGANATDIAILVVAVDDSVMPQTIESINHAKAGRRADHRGRQQDRPARCPRPTRSLPTFSSMTSRSKAWAAKPRPSRSRPKPGSALTKLTDAISLQAEILELKANPDRAADGVVIESQLDKGRGPVATVLVKRGTLKRGDIVVAGAQWGKVRAITDERGQQLKDAGPSLPVEVLGLDGAPDPGEPFVVVENGSPCP